MAKKVKLDEKLFQATKAVFNETIETLPTATDKQNIRDALKDCKATFDLNYETVKPSSFWGDP